MNKQELVDNIKVFIDHNTELISEIFFILKSDAGDIIKRADIEGSAQTSLKDEFIKNLNTRILSNEELSFLPITNYDERKNVLFKYDLGEIPKGLNILNDINNKEDFPLFSFNNDRLEDVTGIVILNHLNGNTLISYKRNFPINLYKRDSRGVPLIKWGNETRFKEMSEDIIRIYPDFDFFQLNDELYIRNLNILEKYFNFHDIIKITAEKAVDKIEKANLIDENESIREMIQDLTYARKLAKIESSSPVLNNVSTETIIKFVDSFPTLKGKFEYNDDKTRIKLKTKNSKKLFLKLLNDDYLQSQLTELHYESLAKETMFV
ncbi:anti-phage protein KwaB [Jeotgalibacillus proteolyticus]|uniref:anti-phage protein KwaB n=1 Tax=Jeotgalibacillus proteolyticus TaxID=2082395 RepID=UPI003CEAF67E